MKVQTAIKPTAPQALLILAGLLTPVFGGLVANDKTATASALEVPVLQHALLALPVFIAMAILLTQRRVQQIPNPFVAGALVLTLGGLLPAVAISSYRAVSINVLLEWVAFTVAFLACVSGLGRRVGPIALLVAIFAATAWVAREGVMEYLSMRRTDPTWRIFAGWTNPNATAAMLVLGLFCGLALPNGRDRVATLLLHLAAVIGGGLAICALLLTGSKGGTLLALPTGLVAFGLVAGRRHWVMFVLAVVVLGLSAIGFLKGLPYLGPGAALAFACGALLPQRIPIGRLLAAFAFGALMLSFFSSTTPGGSATTGASRIVGAAATQDQSATFRLNLWKSAAELAKERPVTGWGLGSFRYESARPGLVTLTVFAHNTYLQLAAEAGLCALLPFGLFLCLWARRVFRGSSRLPESQRVPFAAAIAGLAAVLAHCLVDSDLSYFGLGLTFFMVMGAATVLAADAVAPEFIPPQSRYVAAGGVVVLWGFFAYLGQADFAKAQVRLAQLSGQPGDIASIQSLAGWDGDAAYLWARVQSPDRMEAALKDAYALYPSNRFARFLAKFQARSGNFSAAESTLFPALAHDKNNLPTLFDLMTYQQAAGYPDRALTTAKRLVAVEEGPYFKIRALDQVVPTDTYLARKTIADNETDPKRKAELLAEEVRGMRRYADITVNQIVAATKLDPNGDFAGETLPEAQKKLGLAKEAAVEASKLFRQLGNEKAAADMDDQAAAFDKAIPAP